MKNFLPPCILYVSDPQTRADYCNFYHRTALLSTVFTYIQRPRTLFLHISGLYAQRGPFFTDGYANGVQLSIAAGAACSRTKQMGGFPRKGNILKTKDFDFALPPELIAQTPLEKRDASRLLVLDKESGAWSHRHFYELPELLRPGDCLIMNDSRVLPARLLGSRVNAGGERGGACEVLLLIDRGDNVWECLVRPGKKLRTGAKVCFGPQGELTGEITGEVEGGNRLVRFHYEGIFLEVLERLGQMPIPPYIKEQLQDRERYQTVYARVNGSAAAPTAGLHFTKELLGQVKARGVEIGYVTLHVGLGTFRPVKEEEITDHDMHSEYCVVPQETADLINRTKASGGRVICVGTTSCRTIESWAGEDGRMEAKAGWTNIFIYPGYSFRVMDALITNFHLPESTLLMLVSALAGREHILAAYEEAVRERYRFFSFGDAMFVG